MALEQKNANAFTWGERVRLKLRISTGIMEFREGANGCDGLTAALKQQMLETTSQQHIRFGSAAIAPVLYAKCRRELMASFNQSCARLCLNDDLLASSWVNEKTKTIGWHATWIRPGLDPLTTTKRFAVEIS
jgi:hypothetical protein